MSQSRQLLWGAAGAVDLLWLFIALRASSMFLVVGAVLYGLLLILFLAAESRPHGED